MANLDYSLLKTISLTTQWRFKRGTGSMPQVVSNFVDGYSSKLKSVLPVRVRVWCIRFFKVCITGDLGEGDLGIPMTFCCIPTCTCMKKKACLCFPLKFDHLSSQNMSRIPLLGAFSIFGGASNCYNCRHTSPSNFCTFLVGWFQSSLESYTAPWQPPFSALSRTLDLDILWNAVFWEWNGYPLHNLLVPKHIFDRRYR